MSSLILAYKNFAANRNISHIGLGVSALNTSKVLSRHGIEVDVWPITKACDLASRLKQRPATHVVISAPWIPSPDIQNLLMAFPATRFAVNCHSNVGFLQADSNGVMLVREGMDIEMGTARFHIAGNSEKFCRWIKAAFNAPCTYLPNLYFLDAMPPHRPGFSSGTLRIGAFGAIRPLKNLMSSGGAALVIARSLKASLELWVSTGRTEGGGDTVMRAVHAMLDGVPGVKVVQAGWQSWPGFRRTTGNMHLLLQPSYTESFNMVTADGVAEGVPSVVSEAIDWAPHHWKAQTDDVLDIARVGRALLTDPHAAVDGYAALTAHNQQGTVSWLRFLQS
jgi:hypothetical protein